MNVSPEHKKILKVARKKSCLNDKTGFYSFLRLFWSTVETEELIDNWHIQHLCFVLQQQAERIAKGDKKKKDIIYTLPPETLKTTVSSVFFNAWLWAKYPKLSLLTISGSVGEAEATAIKTKRILKSKEYIEHFGKVLSSDKNRNREYMTKLGGKRYSTGIYGKGVNDKVDIVVLDSVLSIDRSDKEKERNRVYKSFTSKFKYCLKSREKGVFFIVQDIKHPDGLVGRLIDKSRSDYVHYSFPSDIRGDVQPNTFKKFYDKNEGFLFPERLSKSILERAEKDDERFESRYLLKIGSIETGEDNDKPKFDRELLLSTKDPEIVREQVEMALFNDRIEEGDFGVSYVFVKNFLADKKIVINRGGTRSSKTYSLCQQLVFWLFTGIFRQDYILDRGVATIVRKFGSDIKRTVQKTLENEILKEYRLNGRSLYDYLEHNKTDREYRYKGRTIALLGADDEQKIRGYKGQIIYANEGNELGQEEFFQFIKRNEGIFAIDFNPSDPYTWIKTELEDKRAFDKKDVQTIISTYLDNPFLSESLIEEIEYIETNSPDLWDVYGKGMYGKVEGLIYSNWEIIAEMPPLHMMSRVAGWCDFGYKDPFALGVCGLIGDDLYVDEYVYQSKKTNFVLSQMAEAKGYPKELYIVADSSQPGAIEEFKGYGFNMHPVKKYPGSIEHGVGLIQPRKIYITSRSKGFRKEVMIYKRIEGVIIDKENHSCDGVRYYGMKFLQPTGKKGRRKRIAIM